MSESTKKVLKELAVWLVSLPVVAGIFTAVVNLIIEPSKVGIKFTPDHFGSPSLPLAPKKLISGVFENFGVLPTVIFIPLVFIFIYLLVLALREFREWRGVEAEAPVDGRSRYPKLSLSPETRVKVVKWGAGLAAFALIFQIAFTKPLVGDVSIPGKFVLAGRFFVSFNAGLVMKSSFNEVEYTELMLDALKFDGDEYLKFGSSEYWAYFVSTGVVTRTQRDKISAKELARLFDEGLLREELLERAALLMKKGGEIAASEEALIKFRNSQ